MQISTVDILILGAGWTSTFLIPLCKERGITYAATTRDGRDGSIKFEFSDGPNEVGDEGWEKEEEEKYRKVLPDARMVVITFPIKLRGASERFVRRYVKTRAGFGARDVGFVQLGTTGVWDGQRRGPGSNVPTNQAPKPTVTTSKWYDRHSPVTPGDRADAESELLALNPEFNTTVLNLSGLWGGTRSARNWVGRVAPTKEALRNKGSIHLIHGLDVSRAILAVYSNFSKAAGQRWILTDGRVYDWWDLASAWGLPNPNPYPVPPGAQAQGSTATAPTSPPNPSEAEGNQERDQEEEGRGPHARWVRELMEETGVRALPRNIELLGRAMDSREFWTTFGLSPLKARLE